MGLIWVDQNKAFGAQTSDFFADQAKKKPSKASLFNTVRNGH